MSDQDKILMKAMTKIIKQLKDLQETIETMSESVDLLVKIEVDRLKKEGE